MDDVDADLSAAEVRGAVLVQAVGLYGYENAYVLDSVRDRTDRSAVVAVDFDQPDALDVLARLAVRPNVCGVRLFAVESTSRWWLDEHLVDKVLDAAASHDLTAVVVAFDHQLEALLSALRRAGGPIVLDHCGFPDVSSGSIGDGSAVLALADAAHVHVKVTSHNLVEAAGVGAEPLRLVPALISTFGSRRVVWGSDHPQTPLHSYADHIALAGEATAQLDRTDRHAVLDTNSARLFRLR